MRERNENNDSVIIDCGTTSNVGPGSYRSEISKPSKLINAPSYSIPNGPKLFKYD